MKSESRRMKMLMNAAKSDHSIQLGSIARDLGICFGEPVARERPAEHAMQEA
ncbi:MAG TPA: hypothetical protein VIL97_08225 [Thermoanaerobaculia bacterium]